MRSSLIRRCASAVCLSALLLLSYAAPTLFGQGGEPPYFAIRGAKVVPVSGPPMENATVVLSRGIITAVGKDVAIPPEAWVVEGKGRKSGLWMLPHVVPEISGPTRLARGLVPCGANPIGLKPSNQAG